MDITTAFEAALPTDWARQGGDRAWVLVADSAEWRPWREHALQMLDAQEQARVERMRNLAARETLIVAYALHRVMLARFLRLSAGAVPLWRDALGCPRVGEGMAATSLSHAGSLIGLAVGEYRPLGVDVEPAYRISEMPELVHNICHASELDAMLRLAPEAQAEALLALWTSKEAILKALGIGFSQGEMNAFAVPAAGSDYVDAGGRSLRLTRLDGPQWFAAVACSPGDVIEFARLAPGLAWAR